MGQPLLTPIPRTTVTSDICRRLVSHLMRGDWASGERLPSERDLCVQLQVARPSLREALKALEIMGMVESRPGDGTFVCDQSQFLSRPLLWAIADGMHDVPKLIEARALLEGELAALAAMRAKRTDLADMQRQLKLMRSSIDRVPEYVEADLNFHLAIGKAADNTILLNALLLIRNLLKEWISRSLSHPEVPLRAVSEHEQIFDAIRDRDADRAKMAMREHLERNARYLSAPKRRTGKTTHAGRT